MPQREAIFSAIAASVAKRDFVPICVSNRMVCQLASAISGKSAPKEGVALTL
ncbi:MAG: hypothetical protein PHO62_03570 [Sulfurimonas sp.]|uniref:hypothetical protein n=1 Tax=Sulfurimonas sp. TaxID=2022749 RepID=UPI0026079D8C|nr:hypothetical protein [Sulfurimonas sp.]MDD5372491.1 hypothetical protein [Sulfurimonas sp.]